jgi:hypothetical protein
MKKISTLFTINHDTEMATNEVRSENLWVMNGEGIATIKYDGSSCLFKNGTLWKRWDRKLKKNFLKQSKKEKENFKPELHMFKDISGVVIPCIKEPDPITHHFPHWKMIDINNKEDCFHFEALEQENSLIENSTYELIGKKVNGNLHELYNHKLIKHGKEEHLIHNYSFEGIKQALFNLNKEGLVFHHPDGRMAKIRRKDMFDFIEKTNGRKTDWRNGNIIQG